MSLLNEIKIIEETDEYLKIEIKDLSALKLVNFLLEQGKKEEFHLVEMELLLNILKQSYLSSEQPGKDIYQVLTEFLHNEGYMDFNLDSEQLLNKIEYLKTLIPDKTIVNGEIKAFKNSAHSEFNLVIHKE